MTIKPDQLTIDPEVIKPLADRVCFRVCRVVEVGRDHVAPLVMTGPRCTLADCHPATAGRIVVQLMAGERRGFFEISDDYSVAIFGWFVRDPDTEPMVASHLEIAVLGSAPASDGDLGGVFGARPPRGAA